MPFPPLAPQCDLTPRHMPRLALPDISLPWLELGCFVAMILALST